MSKRNTHPAAADDDGPQRRIVPAAAVAAPATNGAASVFALAGRSAAEHRRRKHLPPPDLGHLQVHERLAPPPGNVRKGATKYDSLVDRLHADGMAVTGIPVQYRGGLTKAVSVTLNQRLAAAGSKLLVRTMGDGSVGLFRVPLDAPARGRRRG